MECKKRKLCNAKGKGECIQARCPKFEEDPGRNEGCDVCCFYTHRAKCDIGGYVERYDPILGASEDHTYNCMKLNVNGNCKNFSHYNKKET
ncbi:hypothetical protein KAR91_83825 [Candidatus Pacearchaeota archaeon]|nr:hypothetical protein [Candidatus Pacearchaeota archaeon]